MGPMRKQGQPLGADKISLDYAELKAAKGARFEEKTNEEYTPTC